MTQSITLIDRTMVSRLKKQAKQLHRESGRPHHELLEELARKAGFPNWHQLSLADSQTQPLEARLAKSLLVILDAKEAFDEVGDDFELMQEGLFLRVEPLLQWARRFYHELQANSDKELLEFLNDNHRALRYVGNDTLPSEATVREWLIERLFWQPNVALLNGKFLDLETPAAPHGEGGDAFEEDEEVGPDEPVPAVGEDILRAAFGNPKKGELIIGKPETMERYKTFEGPRKAWNWCLHCEKAYPQGSYRQVRDLQMCPYSGCDGDTVMDLWSWDSIREKNPSYPSVPQVGKHYPLYGTTDTATGGESKPSIPARPT